MVSFKKNIKNKEYSFNFKFERIDNRNRIICSSLDFENDIIFHKEMYNPNLKKNVTVFEIHCTSANNKYFNNPNPKSNILLTIPHGVNVDEILNAAETAKIQIANEKQNKIEQILKTLKIVGFEYRIGCDCPSTYKFIYNICDNENIDYELKSKAIEKFWDKKFKNLNFINNYTVDDFNKFLRINYQEIIDTEKIKIEATLYCYGGYLFSENGALQIEKILIEKLIEDNQKLIENLKQKEIAKAKAEAEIKDAYENEIIFSGTELLSKVGHRLIHSIAARITQNNKIQIYTHGQSKNITNPTTTFNIKDELKSKNFNWNQQEKVWEIENTEDNQKLVIEILKKYDTKAEPEKNGLVKCWECGCWVKPSKNGSWDLSGYYCGC